MLESFRNAAKSWVAKVFMALLVASFAIWGIKDVGMGVGESIARWSGFGPQDLVKVGDVVISSEQFRRDLNSDLSRIAAQTGNALTLDDARRLGIDQQVLDRIIDSSVLDARADAMKLHVSDQSIVADVASNPSFQDGKGNFDPARFRSVLQQNGLDEASFLASERRNRLRRLLTDLGATGTVLPRTLTEAVARFRDETRDARYFSFTVSEADVPAATDADLKKQYEATPAAYTAPEYRSVAAIKVEPSDVASKITVSDEEVTASYEKYKSDYFTPEKRTILQLSFPDTAKADAAKKRVDAGEDFLKIATETGAKESDITFADRAKEDLLDPKIADAAFSLTEGQVSAPVQGDLTTAILKVVKITPEVQKTLAEVKDDLTKRLQLEKAKDEIQSIYDAVEDARAEQTKFEDIAAKAGIPFMMVPAVSAAGLDKDGKDVSLPSKPELLKAAFASDVGIENDALTMQDGYIWYEVREVIPSALKPLADVKEQVTRDYVAAKLRSLASDKAKALVEKAGSTTKIDTLATEAGSEIKSVTGIKRTDSNEGFDGMATIALFSAPAGNLTWSLEADGKTARIIEVSKVNTPPFSAASNETKALADDLKLGLGEDTLAAFMKAARTGVDVSMNDALWQNIRGSSAQQ